MELQEERVVVAGNEDRFSQTGLFPASLYNITVFAATAAGYGSLRSDIASTSESGKKWFRKSSNYIFNYILSKTKLIRCPGFVYVFFGKIRTKKRN